MVTLGVIAAAVFAVAALAACGGDSDEPSAEPPATASLADVEEIVERRCVQCHAQKPTMKGYQDPPANLRLDVPENIEVTRRRSTSASSSTRRCRSGTT